MPGHDVTVNQMQWQPAMLRLTYVAHPEVDDGQPSCCFICPQWIVSISRQRMAFNSVTDKDKVYQSGTVTAVVISSYQILYVTETPEQVALMRDRALGHEPKLGAVA